MKSKELERALRSINKVLADPRVEPDQGDLLRKARRELEAVARSGTGVLLEIVENEAIQRSK